LSSRVAFAWKPSRANIARAEKRRSALAPQFNLYGLAAIMVVILFIFMSPSLTVIDPKGLPVNMPTVAHPTPQPGALREDAMVIGVTRDGHYFFRETEIEAQEIPARIWESIRAGSEIKVYLRADARARTAAVNRAIDGIHQAGIRDLVILTERTRELNP
jgi:biopolymer transport protein ExbD